MALHILDEANRCLECKNPTCQKGCPISTPIPKVIGLLNMKDLIIKNRDSFDVRYYLRKISKIEHDTIIDDAFLYLRSKHEMMAIVEENKEFIGVITIEDIVEEVVGNVFDEYDD